MSGQLGQQATNVTAPGMGSATNNAFGGGVSVPGSRSGLSGVDPSLLQRMLQNFQKTGPGIPNQAPMGWTDSLSQWKPNGNPQQMANMQNAQPWQPQTLANAWSAMTHPGQFIADEAAKQSLLRSAQQKKVADMGTTTGESKAKPVDRSGAKKAAGDKGMFYTDHATGKYYVWDGYEYVETPTPGQQW